MGYMYKINGPALLDKQSNHGKAVSTITTRKFDTAHYELTGELKYLDGGTTMATTLECENAKKMKLEIDSMEKFEAIGGTRAVAREWNVSKSTAHGLKTSLLAKERNDVKVEESKASDMSIEDQEATLEQRNTTTLSDCTIDDIDCLKSCADSFDDDIKCDIIEGGDVEGETKDVLSCFGTYEHNAGCWGCSDMMDCRVKTKNLLWVCNDCIKANRECDCPSGASCARLAMNRDDLKGIVEPEPSWTWIPPTTIEDAWEYLRQSAELTHKKFIEQAEQDFRMKLNQILGGMTYK